MLGAMANEDRIKTAIGGNLGIPALDLLDESIELYVLELSSFQLERTSVLNAEVATVLNISADHLDRHTDMEEYTNEKENIFAGKGVMVINEDDSSVKEMVIKNRETLFFSVQKKLGFHIDTHQNEEWLMNKEKAIIRRAELPLEGLHNVANALAALALGSAIGLDERAMCMGLRGYKGLCHRMQKVAKIKGVTWINDSKATNIGACIAALQGYEGKVILIAGGDAKGADLDELIPAIKAKAKCVLLLGKDANKIEEAINGSVPSYQTNTLQEAVKIAADLAKKGDCVLLSPACASLDQYKNYQERGDQFTAAVKGLAA
jgi:UDP-N-acetylmuramoylalanine--D-glutamate ligase